MSCNVYVEVGWEKNTAGGQRQHNFDQRRSPCSYHGFKARKDIMSPERQSMKKQSPRIAAKPISSSQDYARKRELADIGICQMGFFTSVMHQLVQEWAELSIASRNATGRRQEESGMSEKDTYRLTWQGMEPRYGKAAEPLPEETGRKQTGIT